jgi:hypothetical protein
MPTFEKLPRVLREPTGWIIIVLVLGFFYVQWPTNVRTVEDPVPFKQTLDIGFEVIWETEPELQSDSSPLVWGLTRKGMSFLVQTDELTDVDFETLVRSVADQDQSAVGGAEQEPLVLGDNTATYAFFDAESRIQEHKWFAVEGHWIKVSVLYKPSMESRVKRAEAFMSSVQVRD